VPSAKGEEGALTVSLCVAVADKTYGSYRERCWWSERFWGAYDRRPYTVRFRPFPTGLAPAWLIRSSYQIEPRGAP
jgi:hypothetical protein